MEKKLYGDLTGDRFGKLTVLCREDVKSKSGKMTMAWRCRCDCGNEVVVRDSTLKKQTHTVRSCGCSKEINKDFVPKKLSAEEIDDFHNLIDYVKYNVMGYENNNLSDPMLFRLTGMREGKKVQNKNTSAKALYPYKVILNTFKFSMQEINRSIANKSFYTEELKFRYICAIVEKNLNTVYMRMINAEKAKEKTQSIETVITSESSGAEYQTKSYKTSERLEDLW